MTGVTALIVSILAALAAMIGTAPFLKVLGLAAFPFGAAAIVLGVVQLAKSARRHWRQEDEPVPGASRHAITAIVVSTASAAWMALMLAMGGGV